MSGETPLDESLNPIWVLLAKGGEPKLWISPPGGRSWRESLHEASVQLADGGDLIVSVPRPMARSALARLAGRGGLSSRGPKPKTVIEALEEEKIEVVASYGLWPSARSPRVAFPWGRLNILLWLQTSGVLGGGGNRLWARIRARSILFTPLAAVLTPGLALVTRRTPDGGGG
jgi:hypothetical protein